MNASDFFSDLFRGFCRETCAGCAGLYVLLIVGAAGLAQDEIQLRQADGTFAARTGTILRYDADALVLRSGEREQSFPTDRVISVTTPWDRIAQPAEQLFAERKFELAFAEFGKANEAAVPAWFRQRLFAGRVKSAREMDARAQAVQAYTELLQADPKSRYAFEIPLAWTSGRPDPLLDRQIDQLLASQTPAYQLLGASHGLTSAERERAVQILQQLRRDIDPLIAQLADCQLWRLEPLPPSTEILEEREQAIRRLPEPWQAGPWWLLGNQWERADPERSALMLMRIPILYPEQFGLSARALLGAGDRLAGLGRSTEAEALWRELVDRHDGTAEARVARERLTGLRQ